MKKPCVCITCYMFSRRRSMKRETLRIELRRRKLYESSIYISLVCHLLYQSILRLYAAWFSLGLWSPTSSYLPLYVFYVFWYILNMYSVLKAPSLFCLTFCVYDSLKRKQASLYYYCGRLNIIFVSLCYVYSILEEEVDCVLCVSGGNGLPVSCYLFCSYIL